METKEIFNLIESLKTTEYAHIEINHEGTHLVFDKIGGRQMSETTNPTPPMQNNMNIAETSAVTSSNTYYEEKTVMATSKEEENFLSIDSPIVGTYYNAPSPEANTYVKVGDSVKKGDVVCIIEAMKLMNEIESEVDGEIVAIMVQNESPVEYGQQLFKIKPL
ncbi:acetyl-CoA carboxylase biotin carboxyl carrier protein [Petrocella sp. FN5]|uniref:acetyl-CoA carboxylase biotin carboxyl carrier protein n=1 Tax=Petrocella sp. FN5 TaxID=3032002 RepID=UPI0023DC2620|nr:acetyl-CoA carboxylase biotin carboxyl carrier protein [Petrocella sp. FN5]MDF1617440.1 acetyl-CoA carboxylase biotin carboxyl carrier protein [Petrocella sp. FN5]